MESLFLNPGLQHIADLILAHLDIYSICRLEEASKCARQNLIRTKFYTKRIEKAKDANKFVESFIESTEDAEEAKEDALGADVPDEVKDHIQSKLTCLRLEVLLPRYWASKDRARVGYFSRDTAMENFALTPKVLLLGMGIKSNAI